MRIRIPNNWNPRTYQLPAWKALETGKKRAALNWHRRAGKDDLALHWTSVAAHQRVATYWHMLPSYTQGRKAIWEAVNPHTGERRIDEAFPPIIRKRTDNQSMTIELLNGSMWHVVGSDNYNTLVGSPPYGVVFSEWALADPASWAYIEPILEENGGWAVFIYTSRGRNHGHSLLEYAKTAEDWYAEQLTANDTKVFEEEQLERIRKSMLALHGEGAGEALFQQEYYCSFDAAVLGAYYSHQLNELERLGRIGTVDYDHHAVVETWWDLGIGDSTAIWFAQRVGKEIHLIDYYETNGQPLDHYVRYLQNKPYVYGDHVFPHDVKARELIAGKTREEVLRALNIKASVVPIHRVEDGINAVRGILPMCWFDTKCQRGIDALRQYHAKYNEERRLMSDKPEHDWTSHAADAFRQGAMHHPRTAKFEPLVYDNRGVR